MGLASQREGYRDQDGFSLGSGVGEKQPAGCSGENASLLTVQPTLDSPQGMALCGYSTSESLLGSSGPQRDSKSCPEEFQVNCSCLFII